MTGTASGDKMDLEELKKMAQEAVASRPHRVKTTLNSLSAFNTVSGSNVGLGQLTVQSPVTPTTTTVPTEPESPTWDSTVKAAYQWAAMDPAKAGVLLDLATEIRKHEKQQAKLFKQLRKQLELEQNLENDV